MSALDGYLYVTDGPGVRAFRIALHLFAAWLTWRAFGGFDRPAEAIIVAVPLLVLNVVLLRLTLARRCTPSENGVRVVGATGRFEVAPEQPKRIVTIKATWVAWNLARVAVLFEHPAGQRRQVIVASAFSTSAAKDKAWTIASWLPGEVIEEVDHLPMSPLRQMILRLARE